jgi:6-phosphogluconate dehydrogenase
MQIGYIGLGKMGMGMSLRLKDKGYEVEVYNRGEELRKDGEENGLSVRNSVEDMISSLKGEKLVWLMVSHQAVDTVLEQVVPLLNEGDTIIDGGNSLYKESVRRAGELKEKGINYLDAGVSGGPKGAREGACIMVGGEKSVFEKYEELFKDLTVENGYGYMGNSGAGHYVKMVHNGIEYGMMQAIGEGFALMKDANFNLNMEEIVKVYQHGSVIESRLVGWLGSGFKEYGVDLEKISGKVSHSGEGLWTVEAAREQNIPVPIIEGALSFREESQESPSYTGQLVSVIRNQFGGHKVDKEE